MSRADYYEEDYYMDPDAICCETCRHWQRDKKLLMPAPRPASLNQGKASSKEATVITDNDWVAPCAKGAICVPELEEAAVCLTRPEAYCGKFYEDLYEPTPEFEKELEACKAEAEDHYNTYRELDYYMSRQF